MATCGRDHAPEKQVIFLFEQKHIWASANNMTITEIPSSSGPMSNAAKDKMTRECPPHFDLPFSEDMEPAFVPDKLCQIRWPLADGRFQGLEMMLQGYSRRL